MTTSITRSAAALLKRRSFGLRTLPLLAALFALACLLGWAVVRQALSATVEQQALAVAEIVASQATTARSVYTREVASKLTRDGFGPSENFAGQPGHVPLPAQFLKMMGRAATEDSQQLYQYRPVSKWNLEPGQGLTDDFLRWAWPQLEAQDAPAPIGRLSWRAVSRFEQQDGRRVLRYLSADPASLPTCVSCHNLHEAKPEVVAMRMAAGVAPGKQFTQHQLMGALSITIPLDKAELLAGSQVNQTTVFIFGILVASFGAMFGFTWRLTRQELRLREAQATLQANQGVEQAYTELTSYMRAVDQHAIVSVADQHGLIVQVNDKLLAVSGYTREELLGQDHRVLGSGTHDREFFRQMWNTLARGEVWRGVICNRAKGGQLYWVDSAIVPLKDSTGAVVRYISIRIDITERMRAEADMQRLATRDSLTGLANRNLLRDRMQRALESNHRTGAQAAVLFIDLDQFKTINDSLGHDVGDALLVQVAARLTAAVRTEDTVSRQGGDEFIVFLPRLSDATDAGVLAEKLVRQLREPFAIGERELYIGSSIGIAVYPDDGQDVDTLLKNSDTAMYQVKEAGRNHHAFFTPAMDQRAFQRYAIGTELRRAVERGEFWLMFQPIVDTGGTQLEALEVLLRWTHPTLGHVSPAEFIPMAESSGLIVPIGEWVLENACRQIAQWQALGLAVPRVAINLSAIQIQQRNIVERIELILQRTGISASQLEFEITEGSLMHKTDDVVRALHRLSALGAQIAIDDFGTGYSSLSYLKRLPIDILKIDRSFVMDIGDDADDTAIVVAVIAMARSLKLKVIAEGVETEAQHHFLREQGCEMLQGYRFGRPLASADVVARLDKASDMPINTPETMAV